MGCFLLKFAKILICTILMVAILSVPCFATNEGTYGHYIPAGDYIIRYDITSPVLNFVSEGVYSFSVTFQFQNDNYVYDRMLFYGNDTDHLLEIQYFISSENYRTLAFQNGWKDSSFRYITVLEDFYITDSTTYMWWISNFYRADNNESGNLLSSFMFIFSDVGDWIVGSVDSLISIFWIDESLTFVGILAVASLAMAVSFLIIGLISRFLRFRG